MVRICIGSDHAGFDLKDLLVAHLVAAGNEVIDVGTDSAAPVDYPPICAEVARHVVEGQADVGIVLGGSGQGEQIAANKISVWVPETRPWPLITANTDPRGFRKRGGPGQMGVGLRELSSIVHDRVGQSTAFGRSTVGNV